MAVGTARTKLAAANRIVGLDPRVASITNWGRDTNVRERGSGTTGGHLEIRDEGTNGVYVTGTAATKLFHLLTQPGISSDQIVPTDGFDDGLPA